MSHVGECEQSVASIDKSEQQAIARVAELQNSLKIICNDVANAFDATAAVHHTLISNRKKRCRRTLTDAFESECDSQQQIQTTSVTRDDNQFYGFAADSLSDNDEVTQWYDEEHSNFMFDCQELLLQHGACKLSVVSNLLPKLIEYLVANENKDIELSEYEMRILSLIRRYIAVRTREQCNKYYTVDIYTVMRTLPLCNNVETSFDEISTSSSNSQSSCITKYPCGRSLVGLPSPDARALCVGCNSLARHKSRDLLLCPTCDDVAFVMLRVLRDIVEMRSEFSVAQPRFVQLNEIICDNLSRLQEICAPNRDGVVYHRIHVGSIDDV